MSQVDVGQVLEAHERAVAGGGVDVERGFQRRNHQRIKIGDAAGLDDRHVGQLRERCGRDGVAGDDDEPQPGPLQVRQPHHDLVRRVVGTGGVDHEVRGVRGNGSRNQLPQSTCQDDLAATIDSEHRYRSQREQADRHPPPRRRAESGKQQTGHGRHRTRSDRKWTEITKRAP